MKRCCALTNFVNQILRDWDEYFWPCQQAEGNGYRYQHEIFGRRMCFWCYLGVMKDATIYSHMKITNGIDFLLSNKCMKHLKILLGKTFNKSTFE